jgi:PhoPQ-activated pathogenicity-related protein
MPRQLELWGRYSEQIDDYTRRGLQAKLETPEGKKLVAMVDPWFYRDRLTMPKLLIHGANDRYWATDATRVYWDDLKGRKHLLAVPNGGHGLDDRDRVLNTLGAFFRAAAADRPFPEVAARQTSENGRVRVRVETSAPPKEVRLWTVRAGDLDFRPRKWESALLAPDGAAFAGEAEAPAAGGLAVFAEAAFEQDGRAFTLSTPCEVYGRR